MRLALCILHYGKASLTESLHRHFLEAEPVLAGDMLVLDNASPEPYPNAWQRLPENLYWAGALAWSLDALGAAGYTHVWFCNNDAFPVSAPPYLKRVVARWQALEKTGAATGSKVGILSPSFTANPYHSQMVQRSGGLCRRANYVDGIAPVISLECVAALGGLDYTGNSYGYGVDVWLSLQAARAGWGVWVDDNLVLRHRYHTAAREKTGFFAQAAEAEQAYMTARLGPGWRDTLKDLQQ